MQRYDAMVDEFDLTVMEAMLPIPEQQRRMREIVKPYLDGLYRHGGAHKMIPGSHRAARA